MSFHDDKLWQEAFTALLDVLDATSGENSDLIREVRRLGMQVLTEVAVAVTRRKRPTAETVVALRSLLSVLWAKEILHDDVFAKLDGAYETLAKKLPR